MSLLDKLAQIGDKVHAFGDGPVPFDTVIDEVAGPCEVMMNGRPTVMCGSNNYFGLSFHPEVLAAAHAALDRFGSGTTGSRAANGSLAIHRELEQEFAAFYGKRHALVFTTGYQANLGVLSALCSADDAIVLDMESHASIYDGARLSGAKMFAFRHNSASDLRRKLAQQPDSRRCLVIVEGLYSISGDVAPLVDIVAACREAGALLAVDEAHSFGAYGAHGLGCAEAQGVLDQVDFVIGTFSKTLAGIGGYCVSNHPELKAMHWSARPYVFTASGSPANIAGVRAALTIVRRDTSLRDRLWANVRRVRSGLQRLGYRIGSTESPIIPVQIGAADRTVLFWRTLIENGLYANVVLPPACRADACLLRTSYSAAHTAEQIDRALDIFARVGRKLSIIEAAA